MQTRRPNTEHRETLSLGSRAEPRGMTHGRTDMTRLIVVFSYCFEKGSKVTWQDPQHVKTGMEAVSPSTPSLLFFAYHNLF